MHAARKTDAAPGHALPRNVAVQGLEVSLRHVLQDLLLQRQFGHQSPQTTVLLLQLLHPPCLLQLQSAVFLAPAIIGLFSYARFSAGLPITRSSRKPSIASPIETAPRNHETS